MAGMAGAGLLCVAAGELLGLWFPINKKLWTSSYVVFTAGLALLSLALGYWVLDVRQWRRWSKPFVVFGKNAIAAYVLSEMLGAGLDTLVVHAGAGGVMTWHEILYESRFAPLGNPANASLLYSIFYVLVCWAAIWGLDRKGIVLKV